MASAAAFGPRRVVISDVNSGLYVLSLDSPGSEAPGDGTAPPPTAPGDGSAPPSAGGGSGLPGTPTTPNASAPTSKGASSVNVLSAALAAQGRRASALRRCLARVARHTERERSTTRRGTARRRARAKRHSTRHTAAGRRGCLRLHGRTPGRVTRLRALALSSTRLALSFDAPGTDRDRPPAARKYLVRQSLRPIRTGRDFSRAQALCKRNCRFSVTRIGTPNTLTVTGVKPRTTYYYAISARDNFSGRPGPRSATVRVRTK